MSNEALCLTLAAIAWASTPSLCLINWRAVRKLRELSAQIDREADKIEAAVREARAERRTTEAIHTHTEDMIRRWIDANDKSGEAKP